MTNGKDCPSGVLCCLSPDTKGCQGNEKCADWHATPGTTSWQSTSWHTDETGLVTHFENVSETGGMSSYGDLKLRLTLPASLVANQRNLSVTMISPYEAKGRSVPFDRRWGAARGVHVTVVNPPAYGVVVVKSDDEDVGTGTNICQTNDTLGRAILGALNLSWPGLEAARKHQAAGNLGVACEAVVLYYKTSNSSAASAQLRLPVAPTPSTRRVGGRTDALVDNDEYYSDTCSCAAKVPRDAAGGLNWTFFGPNDDVQYMNTWNRHAWFSQPASPSGDLLGAWKKTGNDVYARYFSNSVADWVLNLPCDNACNATGTETTPDACPSSACSPLGLISSPPFKQHPTCTWQNHSGGACVTGTAESPWQSLEMGCRMTDVWPRAFFAFQHATEFTTSARMLMLLGVSEHNAALRIAGTCPGTGCGPNWKMLQFSGLLQSTIYFPELKGSAQLLEYALGQLQTLLETDVYPDGVETELAEGYDMFPATNFFCALKLVHDAGHTLPPAFRQRVEAMWTYGAFVADQQGFLPRHGDADLCDKWCIDSNHSAGCCDGFDPAIASFFGRQDWAYAFTRGREGTRPAKRAQMFTWAGQAVMRSGWSSSDTWVWFDVGPHGLGHPHRDKLALLLRGFGSMLLVDSGIFAYNGDSKGAILHGDFAHKTTAHNTLTIDGYQQSAKTQMATTPVPVDSYAFNESGRDFVRGAMSEWCDQGQCHSDQGLKGNATHTRAVSHHFTPAAEVAAGASAAKTWLVVIDRVVSDRSGRQLQATWHTHPNATVNRTSAPRWTIGGADILTGRASDAQVVVISASGGSLWSSSKEVRGQGPTKADPNLPYQGWYSNDYSNFEPASALVFDATMSTRTATFGWLIVPSTDILHVDANVTLVSTGDPVVAEVWVHGEKHTVSLPMSGGLPMEPSVTELIEPALKSDDASYLYSGAEVDVEDFGAKADGKTECSASFNIALRNVSARGGGIVHARGQGVYVVNPILLQNNTVLQIAAGTFVNATHNCPGKDFPTLMLPRPAQCGGAESSKAYPPCGTVLFAANVHNFSVRGGGSIDGGGVAFDSPPYTHPRGPLLQFWMSSHAIVEDLNFYNSANVHVAPVFCQEMQFRR